MAVCLSIVASLAAPAASSAGEAAIGVVGAGAQAEVVHFDTDAPGTIAARRPIGGLLAGETIVGLDERVATGEFVALTSVNRYLLLDPDTGATQQPGAPIATSPPFIAGPAAGFDVNPTVDRVRLVNPLDDNMRFNPLTFAPVDSDANPANGVTPDASLAFAPADVNVGQNPNVVAAAYDRTDNDPATPTTLFVLDSGLDIVATLGGGNGMPSPNLGGLFTIGPLGANIGPLASLDIAPGGPAPGDVAYAAAQVQGEPGSSLFTVALSPGGTALTPLGTIPGPPLTAMAIVLGGAIGAASPFTAASEASPQASVRIVRTGDTRAPARVSFRTVDRTALGGRDYAPVAGELSFAQGDDAEDVTIPLLDDGDVEGTETFDLELGPVTGGAVLGARTHRIELVDDDRAPETAPPPAAAAPAADRAAPAFAVAPSLPRSVAALRRARRLRLSVACSEACVVNLTLTLGRTRLGTGVASLRAAGTARATIRIGRAGLRALARARRGRGRATLVLRATAADPARNVASRRLTLRLTRR